MPGREPPNGGGKAVRGTQRQDPHRHSDTHLPCATPTARTKEGLCRDACAVTRKMGGRSQDALAHTYPDTYTGASTCDAATVTAPQMHAGRHARLQAAPHTC